MALELNKLAGQVDRMGRSMADRQQRSEALVEKARRMFAEHGPVTPELRQKIDRASKIDRSWRGAAPHPLVERMDLRRLPNAAAQPVTLIAADGSQIYPDRHGIATYYLINTGSIVLRQGSGQAPAVETRPSLFFEDTDLYDDAGHLRDTEYINRLRDHEESERLAELAEAERAALGGDVSRPILALSDGPLQPWMSQRDKDDRALEVSYQVDRLDRMRRAKAIAVGYIDRPSSAYVLRTLDLAELSAEEISRVQLRTGDYRTLADRSLFADLLPNQRSELFASTSDINRLYAEKGQRIYFFYVNVPRRPDPQNAIIARVELPEWACKETETVDLVHQAIYGDCALTGFPYVLARAHELAVVGTAERSNLEQMLGQSMLRCGLVPLTSQKALDKQLTRGRARR